MTADPATEDLLLRLDGAGATYRTLRSLQSIKLWEHGLSSDRALVTLGPRVLRRIGPSDLLLEVAAAWSMPTEARAMADRLLQHPGAFSHVHLGWDQTAGAPAVYKVYLEVANDRTPGLRPIGLTCDTSHLAFKWRDEGTSHFVTSHYRRRPDRSSAAVSSALRAMIGDDSSIWATTVLAVAEGGIHSANPLDEVLTLSEAPSGRRSLDVRLPVDRRDPADQVELVGLLRARMDAIPVTERKALSDTVVLERLAVGRSDNGRLFLTVYFTRRTPLAPE